MIINPYVFATSVDPDAQAFITAAGITDPTQQSAINTLVVDLKGYGVWTKMKAIYPVVGGVASSHAVNLKTPGTFNLTFASGWTHSSTGMTPTNAYANTFFNPNAGLSSNSVHLSYYSRTQITSTNSHDMGCETSTSSNSLDLFHYYNGVANKGIIDGAYPTNAAQNNTTNTLGLAIGSRTSSTSLKLYFNNSLLNTNTNTKTLGYPSFNLYLGATNQGGTLVAAYTTKQCAFASIGDGLTDTEAANFYTAVQAYQTTLGRQVGVPIVSDSDAQAFLNAAVIEDVTQANAINNLVIGMKADGLWTKMKAIYPVVGGVASSHAVNLKTPGTFNLTFTNAWTHSSTGMTPNGINAYADTFFVPSVNSSLNNVHLSYYSRTATTGLQSEIGVYTASPDNGLFLSYNYSAGNFKGLNTSSTNVGSAFTPSTGFLLGSRINATTEKYYFKGSLIDTLAKNSIALNTQSLFMGAHRVNGNAYNFSSKQVAFASIGDGLSDTEAANLYSRVQTFQTTLNRQV